MYFSTLCSYVATCDEVKSISVSGPKNKEAKQGVCECGWGKRSVGRNFEDNRKQNAAKALKNYQTNFFFPRAGGERTEIFLPIFQYLPSQRKKKSPVINEREVTLVKHKKVSKSRQSINFFEPIKWKKTRKDVFCVPHEAVKFRSAFFTKSRKKLRKANWKVSFIPLNIPWSDQKHYISNGCDTIQSRIYPIS